MAYAATPGADTPSPLASLLAPSAVALVGASERSYLARTVWQAIRSSGFAGQCYPVNPGRTEVFGEPCYPSLAALPAPVDLCLIAVSEGGALPVLRDCVAQHVPAAMLFTLFNSTPASRQAREAVAEYLHNAPLTVCGSGTFGVVNNHDAFAALVGAIPATRPGDVSLVCQSGGILNVLARCLDATGIGLGKAIATGGEDQLDASAYIEYLVAEGRTRAIGCVVEQIKDIGRFRRACETARARGVAVALLVIGRSEKGKEAAFAHSGSLASDSRIIDGLIDQVSAIPITNLTEMVDVLAILSRRGSRPLGARAAIVTISGGETGLAADLAERHGLALPDLQPETDQRLQEALRTPGLSYQNPVDTALGSLLVLTDPHVYVKAVGCALDDPEVDFVMARYLEQEGVFEGLAQYADHPAKPLFLYTRTVYDLLSLPRSHQAQSPLILPDIEQAIAALGKVRAYLESLEQVAARSEPDQAEGHGAAAPMTLPTTPTGLLMEADVFPLLDNIGLPAPELRVLRRGHRGEAELNGLDGPFIAKILSDSIVHRRSAGGVIMNLQERVDAVRAADRLLEHFGDAINGVLVEPMLRCDLELMLGAKRTAATGLTIMLGFGGTFVEDFGSITLRLSPLSAHDAREMTARSGAAAALRRLGGEHAVQAASDLAALLQGFDRLCRRIGPILSEFDVNPLGYQAATGRFCALDAKILLAGREAG